MNWLIEEEPSKTKGAMLSCPHGGVPEYSRNLIGVEVGIHRYMLDTYENDNLADKGKVHVMDTYTWHSTILTEAYLLIPWN